MLGVFGIPPRHWAARHFPSLLFPLNAALSFQIYMSWGSITSKVTVTVLQEVILRMRGFPCGQKSPCHPLMILAAQLWSYLHTDEDVCPWPCECGFKKRKLNGLSAYCFSCRLRSQYLAHRASEMWPTLRDFCVHQVKETLKWPKPHFYCPWLSLGESDSFPLVWFPV